MRPRTIAATLFLILLATACADAASNTGGGGSSPPGSPTPGDIAHATGASALILRVGWEGGFVPAATTFAALPSFSLYGDGTLIQPGAQIEIYPQPALPAIDARTVDEAGVQAILDAAIRAGLEDGRSYTDLGSTGLADAPTTVFTFSADGVMHTIEMYALSELPRRTPQMSEREFEARRLLQALVTRLGSLDDWLPADALGVVEPYTGDGARLLVDTYRPDDQLSEPRSIWPLSTPLTSFGGPTGVGKARCGVVTGGDWTERLLPEVERANQLTPWTDHGARASITVRPLLPDEAGC